MSLVWSEPAAIDVTTEDNTLLLLGIAAGALVLTAVLVRSLT
jgi:hypothetical protein